jgi:transposase-like protein
MPKSRPAYAAEYRQRIIELARSGRSIESLAKQFEPTATTIRNWVRQADLDEGRRSDGLTSEERSELVGLRREVKVLREERDILKKAAAWFAQETNSTPRKGSGS